MSKKLLALLLGLTLCLSLAACGGSDDGAADDAAGEEDVTAEEGGETNRYTYRPWLPPPRPTP